MDVDLTAALRGFLERGLAGSGAMRFLERIVAGGPRPAGSEAMTKALETVAELMRGLPLERVRTEEVVVPLWTRGAPETAFAISGGTDPAPLAVRALGGSVATPPGGIRAGVIEVGSLEEASALGDRAEGRILFFNRPMDPGGLDTFQSYGGAADQRVSGAVKAAEVGALAVLVRSLTLADDDLPHTGIVRYAEGVPAIPAAALGVRSAERLSGMLRRDPLLEVALTTSCSPLGSTLSANVMGEIRGASYPDEVVVLGAHLDTWDLSPGAHDDGAGCAQCLEAARLILDSGVRPARTVRVVLFTSEEFGAQGGAAYAASPGRASERTVAAIESDSGGFAPRGFSATADGDAMERLRRRIPLLEPAGIVGFREGFGGADIQPLARQGTVVIGLVPDSQRYFDVHHCAADTLDAVHPRELELGAAAMAVLALSIAMEGV